MRNSVCFVTVGFIAYGLCFACSTVGQNSEVEVAARGTDFMPPQPFILRSKHSGLADWAIVDHASLNITKVRIIGFAGKTGEGKVDWSSDDSDILRVVSAGLQSSRMRRWALSDFSDGRGKTFGGYLGLLLLSREGGGELIIGVSKTGFYFGVAHGTTHQLFESWLLAKELKEVLHKHLGKELDATVFSTLSGERSIDEQREWYGTRLDVKKQE